MFIITSFVAKGQDKNVIHEGVLWYYYSQKVKLNPNWSLSGIVQYRQFVDREEDYHLFLTAGVSRKIKGGFSVGGGFANLNINRSVGGPYVLVPELRLFQSLSYSLKQEQTTFNWRFMVEERWIRKAEIGELVSGSNFQWRFRNKFQFMFALAEKVSLELSSEVMINAGSPITVNVFDQHRGIAQVHWKLGAFSLKTGYMHWFFQTAGNQHQNRHTLLLGIGHSLDLSGDE